jgi:hypothetical protein
VAVGPRIAIDTRSGTLLQVAEGAEGLLELVAELRLFGVVGGRERRSLAITCACE